jgi:hypothetical protein
MATNREVVTNALRLLTVLDAEETAQNVDAMLALNELNSLMADYASQGADLGYPPQDSLSEDFPMDDQVKAQAEALLALRLHAHYPSATITPALGIRAERADATIFKLAVLQNLEEADMRNIPLGEGARCGNSILTDD